jgi:hypothetical protein
MATLKEIWKNRKQIFEGISNTIVKDAVVEQIAQLRYDICYDCEHKGRKCAVKGTAPCCNECGCSLAFKTRSLSSDCPLGKWKAILSEEEEDKLEQL